MKLHRLFYLLILLVFFPTGIVKAEEFYPKGEWGMSIAQIKALYQEPAIEGTSGPDQTLYYKVIVADLPTNLTYAFNSDSLYYISMKINMEGLNYEERRNLAILMMIKLLKGHSTGDIYFPEQNDKQSWYFRGVKDNGLTMATLFGAEVDNIGLLSIDFHLSNKQKFEKELQEILMLKSKAAGQTRK